MLKDKNKKHNKKHHILFNMIETNKNIRKAIIKLPSMMEFFYKKDQNMISSNRIKLDKIINDFDNLIERIKKIKLN